jgi:hypothetical protein
MAAEIEEILAFANPCDPVDTIAEYGNCVR